MSSSPTPGSIHPQDVANLILYLQTELALLEQIAETEELSPAARASIARCREVLRRSIDQMQIRDWYRELTGGLQDQLGRLEEWF